MSEELCQTEKGGHRPVDWRTSNDLPLKARLNQTCVGFNETVIHSRQVPTWNTGTCDMVAEPVSPLATQIEQMKSTANGKTDMNSTSRWRCWRVKQFQQLTDGPSFRRHQQPATHLPAQCQSNEAALHTCCISSEAQKTNYMSLETFSSANYHPLNIVLQRRRITRVSKPILISIFYKSIIVFFQIICSMEWTRES